VDTGFRGNVEEKKEIRGSWCTHRKCFRFIRKKNIKLRLEQRRKWARAAVSDYGFAKRWVRSICSTGNPVRLNGQIANAATFTSGIPDADERKPKEEF